MDRGCTLEGGLGMMVIRRCGPIFTIAGLGWEGSITCGVIEALGRPYEYDDGVRGGFTDIRARALSACVARETAKLLSLVQKTIPQDQQSQKLSHKSLRITVNPCVNAHPQPLIPLAVRMVATKPVLVICHRLRRRTANPQLLRKSPEHRTQHDIHLGVSERHTDTLPGATSEGYHVVIETLRLLCALKPSLGVELHRVWEDFRVAVHHP